MTDPLDPGRWQKLTELFDRLDGLAPEERSARLAELCGGDETLRSQAEAFLREADAVGVLGRPTRELLARWVDEVETPPREDRLGQRVGPEPPEPGDEGGFGAPSAGEIMAGRYRIVALLGKGGMGAVYRAEDLWLRHTVALKFLSPAPAREPGALQRLVQEVRLAREVAHPNVCRVHDIGEMDRGHYLSMQYIDGESFGSLLRRVGRLPVEKALDVAHQLCAGLAAAHAKGVLHLDLKPANIMIDGRGQALITDFGLASPSGAAPDGRIAGTPAYAAPEQLVGGPLTERTDLFALALVLCEALTGRRVFEATTFEERRSVGPRLEALSAVVAAGVDRAVERVIRSCLEADIMKRPPSAQAVSAGLPGGSPLAAAVAAGRVPSPEIVAASGAGAIPRSLAMAVFAVFLAGLLAVSALNDRTFARLGPLRSPEVLAARAAEITQRVTGLGAPADRAYWFTSLQDDDLPARRTNRLGLPNPSERGQVRRFLYRQSPVLLVPANLAGVVLPGDPPTAVTGMVDVTLDLEGRLLQFTAVPASRSDSAAPAPFEWHRLLAETGAAPADLVSVSPVWTPPVPSDLRLAWEGPREGEPGRRLHITAASYAGTPVYLEVRDAETPTSRTDSPLPGASARGVVDTTARLVLGLTVLAASILLARRNVIRGEEDRRGASRLGLVAGSCLLTVALLRAHHVPDLGDEYLLLARLVAWTLYLVGFVVLLYLAFEPFVRKRWPAMLIGWARALAGRLDDPVVGRDVLIGCCGGLALIAIRWSAVVIGWALGQEARAPFDPLPDALGEPRAFLALTLFLPIAALAHALGAVLLLRLTHMALRLRWLAILAWLAAVTAGFLPPATDPRLAVPHVLVAAALTLLVLERFGLLALVTMLAVADVLTHTMTAFHPSAWYADRALVTLLALATTAALGLRAAVAGRAPRMS